MKRIGEHMGESGRKKEKQTERGELMRYFLDKLNRERHRDGLPPLTMPRMGRTLVAIPTKDLYFLRSVCDDAEKRGSSFSKKFWWEINPKKHDSNSSSEKSPRPKRN